MEEIKIYVGTFRKYNNGSLFGAWLDLANYTNKKEFITECKRVHSDEIEPEFMFQDYPSIFEGLITESYLYDNFFAIRDVLNLFDETMIEPFLVWCRYGGRNLAKNDVETLVADFGSCFVGSFSTEEKFAEYFLEKMEIADQLKKYFDYSAFACDLFSDGMYWFKDGYVFSTISQ